MRIGEIPITQPVLPLDRGDIKLDHRKRQDRSIDVASYSDRRDGMLALHIEDYGRASSLRLLKQLSQLSGRLGIWAAYRQR